MPIFHVECGKIFCLIGAGFGKGCLHEEIGGSRGPFVGLVELVVVETHAHSVDLPVLDKVGSSTPHDSRHRRFNVCVTITLYCGLLLMMIGLIRNTLVVVERVKVEAPSVRTLSVIRPLA